MGYNFLSRTYKFKKEYIMVYKLVTFNIRIDLPTDGKNRFKKRLPAIKKFFTEENIDIICIQELTRKMLIRLLFHLRNYEYCGKFRGSKRSNESNLIFFKKDKFELIETKTLWLSDTPDIPKSRYAVDQSQFPRIITSVKLKTKDNKILNVYNTHFDHQGTQARILSSKQILNYANMDEPVILVGDFNSNPDDEPIKIINKHLTDITTHIPVTFHHFGSGKINTKIDYIFVNNYIKHQNVKIIESKIKGMHLSDHHPIYMEFKI
jgi:endonuclease/exonuclease/phosphatase family metal-dependent hydrolase